MVAGLLILILYQPSRHKGRPRCLFRHRCQQAGISIKGTAFFHYPMKAVPQDMISCLIHMRQQCLKGRNSLIKSKLMPVHKPTHQLGPEIIRMQLLCLQKLLHGPGQLQLIACGS